jgi:enamine deaminase RidA (YjgF/YER057c/UK114 family)
VPIFHNPREIRAPKYSTHGVEVPPGSRTVYITGQIAVDLDGSIPKGIGAQTALVFAKLGATLASAGMDFTNLVKTTVFLVRSEDYEEFIAVRSRILDDIRPASSLVFVKGLPVSPDLLLELEAIAADEQGRDERRKERA